MQTTAWFQALADETRLRVFRVLGASPRPLCVSELSDILRRPAYALSRALGELRKAGLTVETREGRLVFAALSPKPGVQDLAAWVGAHCVCSRPAGTNPDGSLEPGGEACGYDFERLAWRLNLRQNGRIAPGSLPRPEKTQAPGQPDRQRVLFVCVHNSARSQLAEAYLRQAAGDRVEVESAGLEPGTLNPWIVEHLLSEGLDIRGKATRAVKEVYRAGRSYDWVITVCSREAEEQCPVFPGPVRRLNWPFEDPSGFSGPAEEIRSRVAALAAAVRAQVETFAREALSPPADFVA